MGKQREDKIKQLTVIRQYGNKKTRVIKNEKIWEKKWRNLMQILKPLTTYYNSIGL